MANRYFEAFVIGERRVSQGRTITETDIVLHAGQTGDWYPLTNRMLTLRTIFWARAKQIRVALITPNPGPRTRFDGKPKLVMLKALKTSNRNWRAIRSGLPFGPMGVFLIREKSKL